MINQITSAPLKQHMYPQRERTDTKVDDQVSKPSQTASLSIEASQRIVNDKIIERLDKVLQKNRADEIRTLDPKDYTPESVSKQILNFVKSAIDRAESRGDDVREIISQAKQGIDLGFEQAENILSGLNALSGKIAEGVQKTYEMINGGMEEIIASFKASNDIEASRTAEESVSTSNTSTLELAIHTQDGDEINISLSQNQSSTTYNVSLSNESNKQIDLHTSTSTNFQDFNISVNGKLDDAEISAVSQLLTEVKTVSDRFFNGNVDAAFSAGLKLGFDSKELVGFSLALNQNQSESNVKAYREINGFTSSELGFEKPTQEELTKLLTPIRSFSEPLASAVRNIEIQPLFKESSQAAEQMFNYFSQSNKANHASIQQLESLTGSPFEKISTELFAAAK